MYKMVQTGQKYRGTIMKYGIKRLVAKITEGDEYGLYRQNDEKRFYLMVSFSTWKEVDRYGKAFAKVLDRKFDNWIPEPEHEEDENVEPVRNNKSKHLAGSHQGQVKTTQSSNPNTRPKTRRVSGVAATVRPMIAEGKTNEEIFEVMWPKYEEAGRTKAEARELLFSYVKDIRAGKA
jgi:hypothetical protein